MPGNSARNSGKFNINLNGFVGGESVDFENGVANSFYQQEGLDFRSKSSQMTVLPGMAALATSNVLVDLPLDMLQDPTGVRWMIGDQGNLYKVDTSNVITKVATMSEASGGSIVYNILSDTLYMPGQQTVSMYGPITNGVAVFRDKQFAQSASTAPGVTNLFTTASNDYSGLARTNLQSIGLTQGVTSVNTPAITVTSTYTCGNTVSEAAIDRCVFAPDLEPFYSIGVNVASKGTGNLILVLHDGFNRNLATVTVLNANITAGTRNEFVFSATGLRALSAAVQSGLSAAYHFHVYSSVAADTNMKLATINASDMSSLDFVLMVNRMVTTNNTWHPATTFGANLCMGNGMYLSVYNFSNDSNPSNAVWVRERFAIDAGFEICGLSVNNQYLVIAAEKRSSSGTRNFQEGMLYFWDGQNATYNFKIQITMGAPYSIYTFNNISYFICSGSLYAWGGGQQVIKVRPIAYQNTDYLGTSDNTIVNPHMMAPRYNLLMMGYPSKSTHTGVKFGVYSWGSVELIYPNSFGYSYRLSNNTQYSTPANNLQIGMVMNFVDTMYVASRSTTGGVTTYNLDKVDNSSPAATNFSWTSLIYSGGVRYKQKMALRYKVNFLPWPSGATLNLFYNLERGTIYNKDPVTNATFSPSPGDTSVVVDIPAGRFYESLWGFTGTCSSPSTIPTITGINMEIDPLGNETDIRNEGGAG